MASQIVVFDLDGTLVDSLSQILTSCNEAREAIGLVKLDEVVVKTSMGLGAELFFPEIKDDKEKTEQAVLAFRLILREKSSHTNPLFDGVTQTLECLSRMDFDLAIASNKPQDLLEFVVENSALSKFDFYIRGSQGNDMKPRPDMPRDCMRFRGSESGYMVGDRPEDLIAGRAAGLIPVGIALGAFSERDLIDSGAEMAFASWRDFHNFFCFNHQLDIE